MDPVHRNTSANAMVTSQQPNHIRNRPCTSAASGRRCHGGSATAAPARRSIHLALSAGHANPFNQVVPEPPDAGWTQRSRRAAERRGASDFRKSRPTANRSPTCSVFLDELISTTPQLLHQQFGSRRPAAAVGDSDPPSAASKATDARSPTTGRRGFSISHRYRSEP